MRHADDVGQNAFDPVPGLDLFDQVADIGGRWVVVLRYESQQLFEQSPNSLDFLGQPFDSDRLTPSQNLGGEGLLDLFEVLVVLTEERCGFGVVAERDLSLNRFDLSSLLPAPRALLP
jgi:hypothetical protein